MEIGPIEEVCEHYAAYVDKYNALSEAEKKKIRDEKFKERLIEKKEIGLLQKIKKFVKG